MQSKRVGRPSLDEYFLRIADVVSLRSTCLRHQVGAIAVRNKHILSTGYNGAPSSLEDCLELGCLREDLEIPSGERTEICRAIHAEQNVIIQAALHGVSLENSIIYCTHSPCILCTKVLINTRISRYVYSLDYLDSSYQNLFQKAGISYEKITIKKEI